MNTFINFLYAAILSGTPLLFGTLGEIITERVGHLNLGVEGMMWIGAFAGFYTAYSTESLILSILAAFLSSALSAAIYAFLTVTLRANQNVTGLTLTTFGTGISLVLGYSMTGKIGGAPKVSETFASKVDAVSIPATVLSIADDAFDAGIVIIAPAGSYAETWARQHGFTVSNP